MEETAFPAANVSSLTLEVLEMCQPGNNSSGAGLEKIEVYGDYIPHGNTYSANVIYTVVLHSYLFFRLKHRFNIWDTVGVEDIYIYAYYVQFYHNCPRYHIFLFFIFVTLFVFVSNFLGESQRIRLNLKAPLEQYQFESLNSNNHHMQESTLDGNFHSFKQHLQTDCIEFQTFKI